MATDKTKKRRNYILLTLALGILFGGAYVLYLLNMPHLDVQAQKADFSIDASNLVMEYLQDEKKANGKYLSDEGNSKIFVVNGIVKSIDIDMNNQITILLQSETDKAGVKCVFMASTNKHAEIIHAGQKVSIKGIIRSGANYDSDLELYENVLLEKCDIINQ
ncbi:MAG: hypothetical protein PSX36_15465 [bacterium]|nr:hypothetical protein [bacterium]